MNVDPLELSESADETDVRNKASRLNTWVAVSVALLATFMGVCKVKDDNIVQAMQQAQADKIDHWGYYQARVIREEVSQATLTVMRLNNKDRAADPSIKEYEAKIVDLEKKKEELKRQAVEDQKRYDDLNYRDDQFDLSDAFLAISIAMLAVTALTEKRWMFGVALIPTAFGVVMGIAGLGGWRIHPEVLVRLLS